MSGLHITFLGTGTSQGVPRVGCSCGVCSSTDPKDQRTRCSIHVRSPEMEWVVDTGADFRSQCLREKIRKVDAVLYTHAHTDHIMGFDDLRPFTKNNARMPVYGSPATLAQLGRAFEFAFHSPVPFPGYLHPDPRPVEAPFFLGETELIPVELPHGRTTCMGYLMRRGGQPLFAYLTDCKSVPEAALKAVAGVKHLVIDALRVREHPTHLSIGEALEVIGQTQPGQAWITHLCHEHTHSELEAMLPPRVGVAYDGMRLSVTETEG